MTKAARRTRLPSVLLQPSHIRPGVSAVTPQLFGWQPAAHVSKADLAANVAVLRTGARESRRLERRRQPPPSLRAPPSSKVDADPAAQPSTFQRVRRKPRSGKNRYLLQRRENVRSPGRCHRQSRRRQGQFEGQSKGNLESRNTRAGVYLGKPAAVRWPSG